MKKLASLVGLLVGLTLLSPVYAQPTPDELKKLQDDLKKLVDDNAKLAAQVKADADAKAKKGEEPPVIEKKGEPPPKLVVGNRGYKPPTPQQRRAHHLAAAGRHGNRLAMQAKFQTLPPTFDCRDKGWVIRVGDQGNCGSCYLYSTIWGTLTSAFIRAGYGKADNSFVMAVQYGMDRPRNFGGCNGGNGTEVTDWIMQNGWVAESWVDVDGKVYKDYPQYEARSGIDRTRPGAKSWKIADWGYATGDQSNRIPTTEEIKTALFNYGPLNVSLDAGGQFSNGTGTITALGTAIDHEIEMVAYNDTKGTFTLKNQWDTSWGNGGYREITYNAAKRLVDIFWIIVTPLPVPPPLVIVASVPDGVAKAGVPYNIMPVYTGGTGPYSWSFDYGDGTKGSELTHTYAADGKYTLVGTVTDSKGLTAGDTGVVTVGNVPPPPPPPDGDYPTFTLDKALQPGTHVVMPKAVLDRLRVLDEERARLLNPSGGNQLPEIKTAPPPLPAPPATKQDEASFNEKMEAVLEALAAYRPRSSKMFKKQE